MSYHFCRFFCLPHLPTRRPTPRGLFGMVARILVHILILVSCAESLQIPDQQVQVGKIFYYKLPLAPLENIKSIRIQEAGGDRLPDWIYFNQEAHEIVGIPQTKGLHFIEVQIQKNGEENKLSDIFALDIIDVPTVLSDKDKSERQCFIQIKETFSKTADVWRVVSYLSPFYPPNHFNSADFQKWLLKVSVTRSGPEQLAIAIDEQLCDVMSTQEDDIQDKLKKLGLHNEVVRITRNQVPDSDFYNEMLSTSYPQPRNRHYRHNIADQIHRTPEVAPAWMTLSTSTILPSTTDEFRSTEDPLSRFLIPSMTSPTLTIQSTSHVESGTAFEPHTRVQETIHSQHGKYHTPIIYSTPILAPERPTIISDRDEDLLTPTPVFSLSPTATAQESGSETSSIVHLSVTPEITTETIEPTSEKTVPIEKTTTQESTNRSPYINKRLRKLELTAGKYWKFTIPDDTFVDYEDGGTRKLKLTFLLSSKDREEQQEQQPPPDYWIQFDHENQYLYALPTEDDVGKYTFNLVAVDSDGAHITETVEIHVRQSKITRTYTHSFILYNVSWESSNFAFVVEAVAFLMRKITTRVYGDASIQTVVVQKISRNENDNTWNITWTNDTLRTSPCPAEQIQELYSKIHEPGKMYGGLIAEPSRLLKNLIKPDFEVKRVQLKYYGACGSLEPTPHLEKDDFPPLFVRNRIGRLGPYLLGQVFKYQIPDDIFYSPVTKTSTRGLSLSISPVSSSDNFDINNLIFFETSDQTIYGLALNPEQVNSFELALEARDPSTKGRNHTTFVIEIKDEPRQVTQKYTFELFMNLLATSGSDTISARDSFDVVTKIASDMFGDGSPEVIRILSIRSFLYDRNAPGNENDSEVNTNIIDPENGRKKRSHRHKHNVSLHRNRHIRDSQIQTYFEFRWTNRSIHLRDFTCPKELIKTNIIDRVFKDKYDSLKRLRDIFEPTNFHLINIEFIPIGMCKHVLDPVHRGRRPVPITSPTPMATTLMPTWSPTTTPFDEGKNEIAESNEFILTTIIPPVAILVALIFAAIVGCCFHRANRRRKSVEISRMPDSANPEREAFLQKGRTPIIFEFEQQQQQQQQYLATPQHSLISPVIMPPTQPQQMTPLRQMSKPTTYQPLTSQGSQQRRQPPPYYN